MISGVWLLIVIVVHDGESCNELIAFWSILVCGAAIFSGERLLEAMEVKPLFVFKNESLKMSARGRALALQTTCK
jgi:hypothetical protein